MKNPLSFTPKEQMQITLIALGGMIIMIIALSVFSIGWVVPGLNLSEGSATVFKWMIAINAFFGVLFLSGSFIGAYQQYKIIPDFNSSPDMEFDLPPIFDNMKGGKA